MKMKSFIAALRIFLFFTVLTGVVYPLLVTGIAQLMFPEKANGSIVYRDKKPVGSALIGQSFDSAAAYFSSRPSAIAYNPLPSGGSNFGLTSRKLKEQFDQRAKEFAIENLSCNTRQIPAEMLFASASGLDPHISPAAAFMQLDRVSLARHFTDSQKLTLKDKVQQLVEPPQFLCLGEQRVNVLFLNLETDRIK